MDKIKKVDSLMTHHIEKQNKIKSIIAEQELDALIIGGAYNIQYATGVRIEAAHAQPDLVMFALFFAEKEPVVFVPKSWQGVAHQECYFTNVVAYRPDKLPIDAAVEALIDCCPAAGRVGIDDDLLSAAVNLKLIQAFEQKEVTFISCASQLGQARAIKTAEEVELLTEIAFKTDHVINGHFHHLSADRRRTASVISESLRVHSSERDIEIAGYTACARAVIGRSMSSFWAYAPKYGFADADMTQENDPMVVDVLTSEGGYWSNSTRIAISNDHMSAEQERVYGELVRLRKLLVEGLRVGRKCSAVYHGVVGAAQKEGLSLVTELPLGFCVGVSPMEGPFLAPGDERDIQASMVFVLDPVVQHDALFYRSRDTVVVRESGPEIVNWYKDWREPYLAILEL
ncbi:MAG: aminopeptidase P family N-terminal domain-containing protein [Chloroflexota bacterium]